MNSNYSTRFIFYHISQARPIVLLVCPELCYSRAYDRDAINREHENKKQLGHVLWGRKKKIFAS